MLKLSGYSNIFQNKKIIKFNKKILKIFLNDVIEKYLLKILSLTPSILSAVCIRKVKKSINRKSFNLIKIDSFFIDTNA